MSQVVRIPSSIYERLEKHASGFDTPVNVIKRLIDYYEKSENLPSTYQDKIARTKKSISKYSFEGHTYGKGRLVLAVVRSYVLNNPSTTLSKLQSLLPKHIQGSSGVFSLLSDAKDIYKRTGHKRNFINPNEIIKLSDHTIAVSTEWGKGNIDEFRDLAGSLGYETTEED